MKTIEQFILGLEGEQKTIVSYFHSRLSTEYDLSGKISFNIPMYYRKSWVCYLNPLKDGGIELAFPRANELSNEQGILDFKNRKQVAGVDLYDSSNMPEREINEIIHEALILDDLKKYSVRKK